MIIVLKPNATKEVADQLLSEIEACGLKPLCMPGEERVVLGALGDERRLGKLRLESHPMVESIKPILAPYKLVSRELKQENTVVDLDGMSIGGDTFAVIAGPCAIESSDQYLKTGEAVKAVGASGLRGGAFKPRTSPYSFQGLGVEGLKILKDVSSRLGLPAVTEVVDVSDVGLVNEYASACQVGARNMQNFRLLKELGQSGKPVILKRGMAATVEDLLLAAEYILSQGNPNVILCERGIKTFETATRNTLDLNAVPLIKQLSHLPVIVDPSHGTGVRDLVVPMSKAAVACGADGIIVEVHCNPREALSDGGQSLNPDQFAAMMHELEPFVRAAGKKMKSSANN
ncbi:MAG: 3-deoxy-7-phosphoheptulonate synthase [Myxococcota bacterium]|nr:3-deoxy-7-phosphoheptulonate synthase [Myxococcota bacterium]